MKHIEWLIKFLQKCEFTLNREAEDEDDCDMSYSLIYHGGYKLKGDGHWYYADTLGDLANQVHKAEVKLPVKCRCTPLYVCLACSRKGIRQK